MWSPGAQEGDSADRGGGWREGPSEARSGELGPGTTPAMSGPHTGPLLEAPGYCRADPAWDTTGQGPRRPGEWERGEELPAVPGRGWMAEG